MNEPDPHLNEPAPPASRRRRRPLAAAGALAVLVPLIPIVVALSLGGGGGTAVALTNAVTVPAPQFAPAPGTATPTARAKPKQPSLRVPGGKGTLVALVTRRAAMRSEPGGHVFAHVGARTDFGSPNAMWVVKRSGRWLGVISSQAGNNHVGWIPAAGASLSRVDWEVRVSLGARKLTVLRDGKVAERYTVAIGSPADPTPTGRFAVTDRLLTGDPAGPYGCCILALSAKAPHAIQDWSGGNRIAIHSTPETDSIGEAVSHGCVRLTLAEGRWLINHIPLGTPALISS
jgi:lipoprotein-anchoring transpeptidase ErfK/SrfK